MPVKGLDHYNLRADGELLETLRRFYCEVIGLEEGPRPAFNSRGHWLYAGPEAILHLSGTRPGETREAGPTGTFDHVAFRCTEFENTLTRLSSAGVAWEVRSVPGTQVRQVFLVDPAGNGIELTFAGP